MIDVARLSGDQVKFGARVTIVDEESEEEKTYRIVGAHEADMKAGSISLSSPLAKALIGKKVGDSVEVPGARRRPRLRDHRRPVPLRRRAAAGGAATAAARRDRPRRGAGRGGAHPRRGAAHADRSPPTPSRARPAAASS